MILVQGKCIAFQVSAPALEVILGFGIRDCFTSKLLPLYFLGLEDCPFFPSVGVFDSLPSGGRGGFNLTIPSPFLDISCSYVEFTFFVCCNLHGLIKTEICINSLLSGLLDIQEQEK